LKDKYVRIWKEEVVKCFKVLHVSRCMLKEVVLLA
jgi:hypothetical protein